MTDRELLQMNKAWEDEKKKHPNTAYNSWCRGYEAALAQPEPEPVAWGIANTRPTEKQPLMMVMLDKPEPSHLVIPLYTAPPQREWVGLTNEEILEISGKMVAYSYVRFAKDIEAKLKEKNYD